LTAQNVRITGYPLLLATFLLFEEYYAPQRCANLTTEIVFKQLAVFSHFSAATSCGFILNKVPLEMQAHISSMLMISDY